jgi:hypothetical protein
MKLLINENQYKKLIMEYYDSEKLYDREKIVNRLKSAPKYIKVYIKKLQQILVETENGETVIATKIPEVLYQYLFGNF